jgi:DNA (cytosine-5)-methyltransferase 1
LSVAGKRAGLDGERSGLFFEFARIAEESVKDGGFMLIENVPGLFSSNKGEDFRILLETLYECGFNDLAWRTLNSQYFGVPQRRRRVFILGRRSGGRSCAQILLEPESGEGNYQKNNQEKKGNTLASITGLGTGGPDDNDAQNGRLIAGPLTSRYGKGINSTMDDGAAVIAFHHKQDPIHSGEIYPAIGTTTVGMGISGPEIGVRRLTPIECERLQGFEDNWTNVNGASDTKRYAAIGDAVSVPVALWIGRRILKYA